MSFEDDSALARELVMFVDSDAEIYRQQGQPIIKNLVTKMAKGQYDKDKAQKLFMYLAETGAKKYVKEVAAGQGIWFQMFPMSVRKLAAAMWEEAFKAEADLGNYDNYLPKKYQKNKTKTKK